MSDPRILGDPGTDAFQVDKYPFFLINRLAARYNGVIRRRLAAIDLDVPSWRVLMTLGERDGRGVADLADAAVINLSTTTRITQRMAAADLVRIARSAADGRVSQVALTATGRAKLAEARAATAPVYARVVQGLSAAEFERLIGLLNLLYGNLDDA